MVLGMLRPPVGQKLVHQLEVLVSKEHPGLDPPLAGKGNRCLNGNNLRPISAPVFVQNQPLGSGVGIERSRFGLRF